MCRHGGDCESIGNYEFCNCKKGTSGDFCETVDDCEKLSCKEGITECSYDEVLEAAFCKCKDSNTAYDHDTRECNSEYKKKLNSIICNTNYGNLVLKHPMHRDACNRNLI